MSENASTIKLNGHDAAGTRQNDPKQAKDAQVKASADNLAPAAENAPKACPGAENDFLAAVKSDVATAVNMVYIPSLGREVGFREITVLEQKTFAKSVIANEKRPDLVFAANIAMLQSICLDKTVKIADLTELDHIKLNIDVYNGNFFNDKREFTCKKCGTLNVYTLDFEKVSEAFNSVTKEEQRASTTVASRGRVFDIELEWPKVSRISEYNRYAREKHLEDSDEFSPVLFISKITMKGASGAEHVLDANACGCKSFMAVMDALPQEVLYGAATGVMAVVYDKLFKVVEGKFARQKCAQCGEEAEEGVGSIRDFFIS